MKKLIFITLIVVFGLSGFSQVTWAGGHNTSEWGAGDNWSGGNVPTATDDVIIPNNITNQPWIASTISAVAKSINLTYTSGDEGYLQITGTLTVSGDITIGVNMEFKVNPGGTATYLGEITVNGTLTVNGTMELGSVYNPTTGKTWMDRNLGASQIATSSTDTDAYGDLYQWGRFTEGHENRGSGTHAGPVSSFVPNSGEWDGKFLTVVNSTPWDWLTTPEDNLWQGESGTNNPCPSGFRLPTQEEWDLEHQSWATNDAAGAFGSPLKLTRTGYRTLNHGQLIEVGTNGYYLSSTVNGAETGILHFDAATASILNNGRRASGMAVRCIKD